MFGGRCLHLPVPGRCEQRNAPPTDGRTGVFEQNHRRKIVPAEAGTPFDERRMVRDAVNGVNRLFSKNTALC